MKLHSIKILCVLFLALLPMILSGCYYHNQSWNDLSFEEKQEARQDFHEAKEELEAKGLDPFASGILEKVEKALDRP